MGQRPHQGLNDARAAPKAAATSGPDRIALAFSASPSTMQKRTLRSSVFGGRARRASVARSAIPVVNDAVGSPTMRLCSASLVTFARARKTARKPAVVLICIKISRSAVPCSSETEGASTAVMRLTVEQADVFVQGKIIWTASPHESILAVSTSTSVTTLCLICCTLPSFSPLRRTITTIPTLYTFHVRGLRFAVSSADTEYGYPEASTALQNFEIHIDSESDELGFARRLLKWLAATPTRSSITIRVLMKQLRWPICLPPRLIRSSAIDDLLRVSGAIPGRHFSWKTFDSGLQHLQDLTLCLTNGDVEDLLALVRTLGDGYIPELRKLTLALPQVALSRAIESLTTLAELARLIGRSRYAGLETMTFALIVEDCEESNGATPTAIVAAQHVFDALARVRADFIIRATVMVSLANNIHPFVPLWSRAVPFEDPHANAPTRSFPCVPLEISDMIIRCLSPYLDATTLLHCALVSNSWFPASRHALQSARGPLEFTIKEAYSFFTRVAPTSSSTSLLRTSEISVEADSNGENHSSSWNTVLARMARCVPNLRTLHMEGLAFDSRIQAQHAAACLSAFTHLTTLELQDSKFPSFTLFRLLRTAALSKLLPFVGSFYFVHHTHTDPSFLSSLRIAHYVDLNFPAATTETLLAIADGIVRANSTHLYFIQLSLPLVVLTSASAADIATLAGLTSGAAFARVELAYFTFRMENPVSEEDAVLEPKAAAALGTHVAEIVGSAWPPGSRQADVQILICSARKSEHVWKGISRAEPAKTTEPARGGMSTSDSP
ncbi:uncharacterized protein BXZ73DRAFT_83258 [Epithele typhae]|uniref:uncharacterized protein n=1 Tax=Epithele typhae TaxID=378194 RepID=UPI002008DEE5|nr:uncharacterized protein BXZ73DRAFT_83258 [Epithele typhae]KAH9910701.1 hypothetical protein BXZ73DRAFT_83258 [Epithele typhae]